MTEQHGGLVLTRKVGEKVRIGSDITVTVIKLKGGEVRLHFAAPPEVVVDRDEVWLDKRAKVKAA